MRRQPIEDGVIWERHELKLFGFVLFWWTSKRLSTAALLRRLEGVER